MLYRFKSKAAGDVVMLEPNGKQLLEILGKDPSRPGIILPEQLPAAVAALKAAVQAAEAVAASKKQEAQESGDDEPEPDRVSLRTRVAPFIELLQHSIRENTEVVWGI
ncbi:MAG: DUF1840 domain-containing protein [Serpentinimonas sp.]|jgi:hypothetical protein|nr:DUF1840 domain-containing protein [Serpentinimonas sp.]